MKNEVPLWNFREKCTLETEMCTKNFKICARENLKASMKKPCKFLNVPFMEEVFTSKILRWEAMTEGWGFKWNTHYNNSSTSPRWNQRGMFFFSGVYKYFSPFLPIKRFYGCFSRGKKKNREKIKYYWTFMNFKYLEKDQLIFLQFQPTRRT